MDIGKPLAALLVTLLLAGCGGGMQVGGGPSPDSLEGEMLSPDPSDAGEIDDATGTMIPS
jgi:hypothetical protein